MDPSPERNGNLIANPYIVGRPLTKASSALFFGRDDAFTWLEENLIATGQPNALMLYGRRRIGKTSTLYQLVEGERGRALRENPVRPIRAAYIDLQRYAGRPIDEWLRRLARDIGRQVEPSGSHPDSTTDATSAFDLFDLTLDELEQSLPGDSHCLVALDEFEQIRSGIEGGSLSPDILPFLRSQFQHRRRITFLISGALGLLELFWNPIVNLMGRYELGMLDYGRTAALVRTPLEGKLLYEDAAVDIIWQQTAGHPYLIQTICHRLVSLMNRRGQRDPVRSADVEHVLRALEQEGFTRDRLGEELSGWNFQLPSVLLGASQ